MTQRRSINSSEYVYTDTGGKGQVMVFIHGLPTSRDMFLPLIEYLKSDYRCIAIDLLDYGESGRLEHHIEHRQRAANLIILFQELNLADIILVCHDLGVSVVMDIMAQSPERISRLVVMSPPVYPDFQEPRVVKMVRSRIIGPILITLMKNLLLRRSIRKGLVNKNQYDKHLKDSLEKSFHGPAGGRALLRNLRWGTPSIVFAEYPEVISSIAAPTLVIQGLSDPYIPVEHARRIAADLPDSKLTLLENAGHFLPIDVPETLNREIRGFLSN